MVNSLRISEPGEVRLRNNTEALNSCNGAYSPECLEWEFSEDHIQDPA
jgi:hypothetical protein